MNDEHTTLEQHIGSPGAGEDVLSETAADEIHTTYDPTTTPYYKVGGTD